MKRFKSCYDRQKKMRIELNWIELKIEIKRLQNRPAFSKGHSKKARLHGLMMCIEVQVYVSMTSVGVFARGDKRCMYTEGW